MNAPQKLELKQAGQSALLHVVSAKLATVGQYPEVEFVGTDDTNRLVLIAVNKKSADRQLDRCNLTVESAAGKVLRFGRSANAKDATKPFWDIEVVGDAPKANGKPVEQKAPEPPADDAPHPAEREAVKAEEAKPTAREIYLAITNDTLKEIVPLYVAAKIPVTMEAVAAIIATRYIAATRNGH